MPLGLVIVGAGPGGLAPLFAAASNDRLQALLAEGVLVIDKSSSLGAGTLHRYSIQSDSAAEAFLDILVQTKEPTLSALLSHPIAQEMASHRGDTAPLALAAQLQALAGKALCSLVDQSAKGAVLPCTEALSVHRLKDDLWEVHTRDCATQKERRFITRSVHLATGAHQPAEHLQNNPVAGVTLSPRFSHKLMQSGELFTPEGTQQLVQKLAGKADPRIVIVGGSTSAGSAAVLLLRRTPIQFQANGVTILHRGPLRLFYPSADEALADGYTDFTASDVCHISGRVYRLSGFRSESKDLIRAALNVQGRVPDPRLRLLRIGAAEVNAEAVLEAADIIIAATGYRPRMCNVFDEQGRQIALHEPTSGNWAMVDQQCRVLTHDGVSLAGLTAMGLAIGPAASHELGGEANFKGQVNSLWLWQNRLGLRVAEGALQRCERKLIPLMRPSPPALSQHIDELRSIEASNVYSNFGPVAKRFERELVDSIFDGVGHACTTSNATLALMIALRDAIGTDGTKRYALMPSFTFAAAAQAALWCGLTPLYCDIHPQTWLPCAESEERLLEQYAGQIAVVVPNATFGNNLDLRRYTRMHDTLGMPVVVDAAACLGSLDMRGAAFGKGSSLPIVFSMHATKVFATGEGGIIYSSNQNLVERLRAMASFGFHETRVATMLGMNAKMSEVASLTALLQLRALPAQVEERQCMSRRYGVAFQERLQRQHTCGRRQVRSFESVLLPVEVSTHRERIMATLKSKGIGTGSYFSPHLAQQPFLRQHSICPPLPASDDIASRILTLPLYLGMTQDDIEYVAFNLLQTIDDVAAEMRP